LALRFTTNNPTYVWRDGLFCPGDPRITPESKNLPTAEAYLPSYIYGEEKLFRGVLLKTSYGVVPFLPPWASGKTLKQFDYTIVLTPAEKEELELLVRKYTSIWSSRKSGYDSRALLICEKGLLDY